jgi:CBS domain-containing protein
MKRVADLMSQNIVKVTSVTMVPEVAQKMKKENIGAIPVEENGQVIGIVTDRDVTTKAVASGQINLQVKDIMSKAPTTIQANATVQEALQLMVKNNVRRLPVMKNGQIAGIVSLEDLVEAEVDQELLSALKTLHKHTRHQ